VHIITKYKHLKGVEIHDTNIKTKLPTDLILQSSEYAKIKTNLPPRVGEPDEPIEEFKSIGSTIMYPAADTIWSSVYLTRKSSSDYV